ncbi:MAG: diguanylate cyclase [Clostridia bacterium]|nr:diguanylate cyclase [Clostridia bacterium]
MQYDFDIQTQIKNRTAFDKEMLRKSERNNVTLFVFDLNNLKSVNDQYGHIEGDILIKSSATLLNRCFIEIGEVFRKCNKQTGNSSRICSLRPSFG